jgi:hypothetical protein
MRITNRISALFSALALVVAVAALWFSHSANDRSYRAERTSARAESVSARAETLGGQAGERAQAENVVVQVVPGQPRHTTLVKISNYGLLTVKDAVILKPHARLLEGTQTYIDDDVGPIRPCTQAYANADEAYGDHPEVVFTQQDGTEWVRRGAKSPVPFVALKGLGVEDGGQVWKTRRLRCQGRATASSQPGTGNP